MIKLDQNLKITCLNHIMYLFLSLCVLFPIILQIWEELFLAYMQTAEKDFQTNNKHIWIVTNVSLVAICFQLPQYTICVNTQIAKALMATAFESVQSNSTNIMPAPNIMNHAFLYFIKTVGMHCKLAIRYHPI